MAILESTEDAILWPKDTMNKKDASAVLGVSIRLVEKYASEGRLGEVKYVRGKTGKQADFDPAGVEKLKAELESIDYQLVAPNRRRYSPLSWI